MENQNIDHITTQKHEKSGLTFTFHDPNPPEVTRKMVFMLFMTLHVENYYSERGMKLSDDDRKKLNRLIKKYYKKYYG